MIDVDVFQADNSTHVGDITLSTERTFQRVLNDAGNGSFKVPTLIRAGSTDKAASATQRAYCAENNVARVKLGSTARYAGRIKPGIQHSVTRAPSGGGTPPPGFATFDIPELLQEFAEVLIRPAPGTQNFKDNDNRVFNWASAEVDDSGWDDFTILGAVESFTDGRPYCYPDPLASRINHSTDRRTLIRFTQAVTTDLITPTYMAASGTFAHYLQGVLVGTGPQLPLTSDRAWHSVPKWADNRNVVFAWDMQAGEETTPWFVADIYGLASIFDHLTTSTFLAHTGVIPSTTTHYAFKCHTATSTSTPAVGPSIGKVLWTPVAEAQADGQLSGWTRSFSDTTDSNGATWDNVVEVTAKVGTNLLDFFKQVAEVYCDFWCDPTTKTLHAAQWRQRGTFHTTPTTAPKFADKFFKPATGRTPNIVEMDHDRTPTVPTRLLVRWAGGRFWTGTGHVEAAVDLGNYTDRGAAEAAAAQIIAEGNATAAGTTITVVVQPTNGDDVPFVNFDVGDGVFAPNRDGSAFVLYRVVSITVTESTGAQPRYVLELNSLAAEEAATARRWLARSAPGLGNGLLQSASPASDLGVGIAFGEMAEIHIGTFNQPSYKDPVTGSPTQNVIKGESDTTPISQRCRIYRYDARLSTQGTTNVVGGVDAGETDVDINVSGSVVDTIVFPSAYSEHARYIGNTYADRGDYVTLKVTKAGQDAAGLVVDVYATDPI